MRVRVRVRTEEGTERKSKSKRGKGEGGKGERGAAAVFGNTVRTPSVRFVFAFRLFFCSLSFRFFVLFPPPHPPPLFLSVSCSCSYLSFPLFLFFFAVCVCVSSFVLALASSLSRVHHLSLSVRLSSVVLVCGLSFVVCRSPPPLSSVRRSVAYILSYNYCRTHYSMKLE